jgi:hypothetical protein
MIIKDTDLLRDYGYDINHDERRAAAAGTSAWAFFANFEAKPLVPPVHVQCSYAWGGFQEVDLKKTLVDFLSNAGRVPPDHAMSGMLAFLRAFSVNPANLARFAVSEMLRSHSLTGRITAQWMDLLLKHKVLSTQDIFEAMLQGKKMARSFQPNRKDHFGPACSAVYQHFLDMGVGPKNREEFVRTVLEQVQGNWRRVGKTLTEHELMTQLQDSPLCRWFTPATP